MNSLERRFCRVQTSGRRRGLALREGRGAVLESKQEQIHKRKREKLWLQQHGHFWID